MPAHEILPDGSFSVEDLAYLSELESQFRNPDIIDGYDRELLAEDPEMHHLLTHKAAELAPRDPGLHGFYFTEMLLLVAAVKRVGKIDVFKKDWADNPPVLS